jgi:hypothetical protein
MPTALLEVSDRLQAVDETELHYRPLALTLSKKKPTPAQRAAFNKASANFRQHLGSDRRPSSDSFKWAFRAL